MILFRVLLWLLLFPLRLVLAALGLAFRILGGVAAVGGRTGVSRGPLNRHPTGAAWEPPWGRPWT